MTHDRPDTDDPAAVTPAAAAAPPATGDRAVDEAIALVSRSMDRGPAERVEALGEAHRRLQARLTAPPPRPGDDRPGPPGR